MKDTIKAHTELFVLESIYDIEYIQYFRFYHEGYYFLMALFAAIPLLYLLYHLHRIRHLMGSIDQRLKYIEYRRELHREKSSELDARYRELYERIKHLDNNYTDQEVSEWFKLRQYLRAENYGDKRDIGVPTIAETVNWSINRKSNNVIYKFFGWLLIIVSLIFMIVTIFGCRNGKIKSEWLHEQWIECRQNSMHHDAPTEEVETISDADTVDPLPETAKPATSAPAPKSSSSTHHRSYSHSSGSSYSSSTYSSRSHSSYNDDDDDDDDTWYRDEDDADEQYEYDYWE